MPLFALNRELLNVKFEGYKLSSDSLVQIRAKHAEPVGVAKLRDDEFSYQYVRAYTLHNHLHWNPSDSASVYWCNEKLSVVKATLCDDSISSECVFSFPNVQECQKANFSVCFLSKGMGVTCAGDDKIILFQRKSIVREREALSSSEEWSPLASVVVGDSGHPVVIVTAALGVSGDHIEILCAELLFSSATQEPGKPLISYQWVRINIKKEKEESGSEFISKTMCTMNSKSHALYSAFQWNETNNEFQLLFMSETEPTIASTLCSQSDDAKLLTPKPAPTESTREGAELSQHDEEEVAAAERHYGLGYKQDENEGTVYTWDQSEEDVVVTFKLPADVTKKDLCVRIDPPEVVVGLSDGTSLLRGELTHSVDKDGCTWTLEGSTLEMTLTKKMEGLHWKYLLQDKQSDGGVASVSFTPGLEELSEEEKQKALDLLKKLSEGEETGPSEKRACPASTVQNMLEECDRSEEEPLMFVVTEDGRLEAKVDVGGHQVLFVGAGPEDAGKPGMFALRHDVDAIVWLPLSQVAATSHTRWTHHSTLNALGYIQASKRERKFTCSSPDLSYAVICDSTRHVFVYYQPDKSSKTAVEYVHTFLEPTTILGVVATSSNTLYILTDRELCALRIPKEE